jgi:hypothetical protein
MKGWPLFVPHGSHRSALLICPGGATRPSASQAYTAGATLSAASAPSTGCRATPGEEWTVPCGCMIGQAVAGYADAGDSGSRRAWSPAGGR